MKFLIVGDLHYKGVNPVCRLDDYQAALDKKIREIHKLAEKHEVAAVIQTGDLLDSPGVSYPVLIRLMHQLTGEKPWLTVAGNHDLYAANPITLPRTPLALLQAAERIWLLKSTPEVFGAGKEAVYLYGKDYSLDQDDSPFNYNRPLGPDRFCIGVYHGMLVQEPIHPDVKHTLIRDIPNPPDVTICGHVHSGWGVCYRPDGKIFINPGAICRDNASQGEFTRPIQVCLLTIINRHVTTELIPLQSARLGCEVLSRQHIDEVQAKNDRLDRFLDLLQEEGERKFLQVGEILSELSRRQEIPAEARELASRYIARAREELSRP